MKNVNGTNNMVVNTVMLFESEIPTLLTTSSDTIFSYLLPLAFPLAFSSIFAPFFSRASTALALSCQIAYEKLINMLY